MTVEQEQLLEQARLETERYVNLQHALLDAEFVAALIRDGIIIEPDDEGET